MLQNMIYFSPKDGKHEELRSRQMKKGRNYDVFISYRRKTGVNDARLLQQALRSRGYRVFFDYDSLRDGKFDERILSAIDEASVFVLMLTEGSLDNCANEGDWVRIEVAHALASGKKIVPVLPSDQSFEFPAALPADVSAVKMEQISELNKGALFEESVDKFVQDRFPASLQRLQSGSAFDSQGGSFMVRHRVAIVAVAAAIVAVAGIAVWRNEHRLFPYPFTHAAKQQVDAYAGVVLQIGGAYNEFNSAEVELLDKVWLSVESGDKAPYQAAVPEFMHRLRDARRQFDSASESLVRVVRENPGLRVDRAYIPNFLEGIRQELDKASEWCDLFRRPCDPEYLCSKADRLRLVNVNRKEVRIYADVFAYSVMALFDMISPAALGDFREIAAKQWTALGRFRGEWLSDQKLIEHNVEALLNELQEVVTENAQIIGSSAQALEQVRRDNRQKRIDAGMSPEQAERIGKKEEELANLKARRDETKKALAATRERIRKKFAPRDDDDVGILWGKALRFMSVKMPEDAKLCIDALRKRNTSDFPAAALDVAEAIFLSEEEMPFNGGVLVCGYEPPATIHAIYKIGDVITEVNGKPCQRFEDYRGKAGNTYTIYRRNAKGSFDKLTKVLPEDQPRVALVNLVEQSNNAKGEKQ